jgi:hypothetical protein
MDAQDIQDKNQERFLLNYKALILFILNIPVKSGFCFSMLDAVSI